MKRGWLWAAAIALALLSFPPDWYPQALKLQLTRFLGAPDYRPMPGSHAVPEEVPEPPCPPDPEGWRQAQVIEGVQIQASPHCVADNPWIVAAVVRGTNNVPADVLARSGLTHDAVEIGRDLDSDGDPDEIHIRLEVAELNGGSGIIPGPVTRYPIAPGVEPGFWVFAPKLAGMAVENLESQQARPDLRLPAPAIRVEQGDVVQVTIENSHYMPHTIHLHGVDHGFVDASGEGNDGVPMTSEIPVMPGEARTYDLKPRHAGTMFYHCHVHAYIHVMMGLQGLFVIEENRPDNWLQTLNIGAGLVRASSRAVRENYAAEYDLHYQDIDRQLAERISASNDPRVIIRSMHREYDITDATQDYFLLNGRSFPYTFRESLLVGEEGDRLLLRVVNGGMKGIALHTHGHKFTAIARDGAKIPEVARAPQDVAWFATSERAELELALVNDGLHAYGPGIWPFHDHQNQGVTTDGIGPGGNVSAIVYSSYLDDNGWPRTRGVPLEPFFTKAYYRKEVPIWRAYAPGLFDDAGVDYWQAGRLIVLAVALGMLLMLALSAIRSRLRGRR